MMLVVETRHGTSLNRILWICWRLKFYTFTIADKSLYTLLIGDAGRRDVPWRVSTIHITVIFFVNYLLITVLCTIFAFMTNEM